MFVTMLACLDRLKSGLGRSLRFSAGVFVLALLGAGAPAQAAVTVYGVTQYGSLLGVADGIYQLTGVATPTAVYTGAPFLASNPLTGVDGVASLEQCPDGTFYFGTRDSVNGNKLWKYAPSSAAAVLVGSIGANMNRLACAPVSSEMYGMYKCPNKLHRFSKTTGAATEIPLIYSGSTGPGLDVSLTSASATYTWNGTGTETCEADNGTTGGGGFGGDIAFDNNGTLYLVGNDDTGNHRLWTINPTTGVMTDAGLITGTTNIPSGIEFDESNTLVMSVPITTGGTAGGLYTVSASGGAVSSYKTFNTYYNFLSDLAGVDVTPSLDLSITKTDGVTTYTPGGTLTYTLVVTNKSSSSTSGDGAIFKDAAVANLTVDSVSCGSATGGAACPASASVTKSAMQGAGITIPTLPAGGSVTFTIATTVSASATGSLTNTGTVDAPSGKTDTDTSDNTASDTDTPAAASLDLSITKTDGVTTYTPGQTLTYTLVVTNKSASTTTGDGAIFKDAAVANLTVDSVSCGSATGGAACPASGSVTKSAMQGAGITIPTLPIGGSVTFTVATTVSASATGSLTNTGTVDAPSGKTDTDTSDNTASDTDTPASSSVDLSITKTDGVTTYTAGGTLTYTMVVTNKASSTSDADGAVFADPAISNFTVATVSCGSATGGAACPASGSTTVSAMQGSGITIPTFPIGSSVTLTMTGLVSAGTTGDLTNTATIAPPTGKTDTDPSDNTASDTDKSSSETSGVSGRVWRDFDYDHLYTDGVDEALPGWTVSLYRGGTLLDSMTSGSDGLYSFTGLTPSTEGDDSTYYEVRFTSPSGSVYGKPLAQNTNDTLNGTPDTDTVGIYSIKLVAGSVTTDQNLPIDPSGVVYDAVTRVAVANAQVRLDGPSGFSAATHLLGGSAAQIVTTDSTGVYQFVLLSSTPAGEYTLTVTPPSGYIWKSQLIVPNAGTLDPGTTPSTPYKVQSQAVAPTGGQSTLYYLKFNLASGKRDVVNNHIPIDPSVIASSLWVEKSADRTTAEIGDAVKYTVKVHNPSGQPNFSAISLTDTLPLGFRFVPGTVRLQVYDATSGYGAVTTGSTPTGSPGPQLTFALGALSAGQTMTVTYYVRLVAGATAGNGRNCVQATGTRVGGTTTSNTACATVKPTAPFRETCVIGKLFVDCNHNLVQDAPNELGIPGVRFYFEDGTFMISDEEGKYGYCGLRATTHVLTVDRTTLPVASRLIDSSSRHAGDPVSRFVDLKYGELHKADFVEGSCSETVLDQVKARRSRGEVFSVDKEHGKVEHTLEASDKGATSAVRMGIPDAPITFDSRRPTQAPARQGQCDGTMPCNRGN